MLEVNIRGDDNIIDLYRSTVRKVSEAIAMPASDPPDPGEEYRCSAVAVNALASVLAYELMDSMHIPGPASVEDGATTVNDLAKCMLVAAEAWATRHMASRN